MAAVCCRADRTREHGCGYTTTNSEASNSAGFVFMWCTIWQDRKKVGKYYGCSRAPIYTVEKAGFQNLFHVLDPKLDPSYKLPGRKHFGRVVLPRLYNSTRAKVTKDMEDVQFFFATTKPKLCCHVLFREKRLSPATLPNKPSLFSLFLTVLS